MPLILELSVQGDDTFLDPNVVKLVDERIHPGFDIHSL
jgi:hypothetical protein